MKQNKISFDEYFKSNAVIDNDKLQQNVFVDAPKKFDFTIFFLCIIAIAFIGITFYYYSNNYVPISDEIDIGYISTSSKIEVSSDIKDSIININTADIDTLCKLKGIGETRALAIVSYRTANGDFESIEQIKEVSGIGDAIYKQIKDKICV